MKNIIKHFITITKHKWYVFIACARSGIIWRGIKHDISKFSLVEFCTSAKHFNGTSSPVDAEKNALGYSKAWAHHKGRNSHHWQYWTDWDSKGNLYCMKMPIDDVKEMICDWIGAGKAYSKNKWTTQSPLEWFDNNQWYQIEFYTKYLIHDLLIFLKMHGEKAFYKHLRSIQGE